MNLLIKRGYLFVILCMNMMVSFSTINLNPFTNLIQNAESLGGEVKSYNISIGVKDGDIGLYKSLCDELGVMRVEQNASVDMLNANYTANAKVFEGDVSISFRGEYSGFIYVTMKANALKNAIHFKEFIETYFQTKNIKSAFNYGIYAETQDDFKDVMDMWDEQTIGIDGIISGKTYIKEWTDGMESIQSAVRQLSNGNTVGIWVGKPLITEQY